MKDIWVLPAPGYRAIVIKSAWYWYNDRWIDKGNRIKDPEMKPQTYGYLIFDKEAKTNSYLPVQSSSSSGSRTFT